MKTILTIVAALTLCMGVRAGEFNYPIGPSQLIFTNSLVSSNTAGITSPPAVYTNVITTRFATYHTFQMFYQSNITGTASVVLESTIDGQNWIGKGGWTNTVTSSGELTFTGKWYAWRARVSQGTNSVLTVNHMAQ